MFGVCVFLSIILGLVSLFVGIAYFLECWRCSQIYTMFATVLPVGGVLLLLGLLLLTIFTGSGVLGALALLLNLVVLILALVSPVFHILLLVKFWDQLRSLFFVQLLVGFLSIIPSAVVGAEMAERAQEMAAQEQAEEQQRIEEEYAAANEQHRSAQERRERELHNQRLDAQRDRNRDTTPPPRPDEPIFEPDQLVAGLSSPSASVDVWPVLTVPELDLSNSEKLDLHGYELSIPETYKIDRVEPLPQTGGMQWWITGGLFDNGRPVEIKVTVATLPEKDDGRVYAPSWSELLGQAGVSRANHKIEYGRLGQMPFVRCANALVKSGHGVGKVRYLGLPSPENPQRIEIEFATDPAGFGRAHALTCEAIARSLTRSDRVMMPGLGLADVAGVSSKLTPPTTAGTASSDWQVRGPFALAISDHANASCSRWSPDGQGWRTTAQFSGANATGIDIRLQPDDDISVDRVRPIALQGPLRNDGVACAYGGEASYVKLWNDAVFTRIEHTLEQHGDSAGYQRVTYHGYLNQHRVDIQITNRDDSAITMAELEDTLLRSRLATPPEMAEQTDQADWLKELLSPDQPAFIVAGGVDATRALLLDERGGVAVSPQYDPMTQRMFQVFPSIDDATILENYEQWTSAEDSDELLGAKETLGEIQIQPIAELRASHRAKQLSWQTKTKSGTVGMTVHLEALKEADREIQTPVVEVAGRLRVRLGRRVIQPSQTPEVTYREMQNLRIWKINVPASARQKIARCHYLAIVPDNMIVISTSYHADRPEQLEAFDASVATLVYKGGEALKREEVAVE